MWLFEIFEREFGFSDVQSNYSRVYAWMANQLGHMTLGLATALLFGWIYETFGSTARLVMDWRGRPAAEAEACDLAIACIANNYLILFACGVVIAAIAAVSWRTFRAEDAALLPGEGDQYRPLSAGARRAAAALLPLATVGSIVYLLSVASSLDPAVAAESERIDRLVATIGAATATFATAAGVVMLCRDQRFFTFALIALFGAFWIGADGAGAPEQARRIVALALAVVFCAYALYSTAHGAGAPERMTPLERWVQAAVVVGISIWFIFGTYDGLEEDWPRAVAAAIASCTLWWVKEFGSDIPNVYREVAVATARRPKGVLGDCTHIDDDYVNDARMDARTDAMFYFAGAWIGAGVLSNTPVMTGESWRSGSELLGLIVFILIFLFIGKNWAFRQQALDLAGLDRASRLAVFRSALRMVVVKPSDPLEMTTEGGPPPELPYVDEPMHALRAFSRGRTAEEAPGFDHLIVFGAVGSGRSPLGRAIASEAALSDLPTLKDRLAHDDGRTRRTARYISSDRLRYFRRDVRRKEELTATPPLRVAIDDDGAVRPDPELEAAPPAPEPGAP
ncbi:MAG: hypothetical protein AAGF90_14990, partial [Pseudomonadota bacterium]